MQQSPPTYHSNQPHYPSSSPQLAYQQQQHQQQHQQQQEAGAQPPPPPPPSQHHHHQPPPHPHAHSQQQHHHPHQTHPAYHRSASDHNDRHYVPFSPVHHHQPPPTASGPIPISAYGYVQQQSAVQQVPLSVKGGHGQKQSLERSNNNRISEEEDKQARIMSTLSREPYSNDGFNSIGPAAATYADPYNNNPSNTISSIVHSPAISVQDLPTTLPPLNPPMMSNKSERPDLRTATAMPYDIRDQALRDNGPPPPPPPQQHHHPQHQQQQQQAAVAAATAADLVVGELSPYGCDVPGCYASFPASSGLFYHMKTAHPNLEGIEKPYRCAMPNCTKRYKNINGLQYHLREAKGTSGHPALTAAANAAAASANGGLGGAGGGEAGNVIDERLAKSFKCQAAGCKKAYRTQNGLRYHQSHVHSIPPASSSSSSSSADHLRYTSNPRNAWQ